MHKNLTRWGDLPLIAVFREIARRAGWRLIAGVLSAAISLAAFLWLSDEVFKGEMDVFDHTVRMAVHQIASPPATTFFIVMTTIGSAPALVPAGICIVAFFVWTRWKRAAALLTITMAGHLVSEFVLKEFFQRIRPEPFFDYPLPPSYSFPSGHSFASVCFFGILAWLVTARVESLALKIAIWTAAGCIILLIGISRIYLGVHHPSDVVAAYLAAIVWVVTVASADHLLARRARPGADQ